MADPQRAEHGPAGFDHEHGEHDEDATRGRQAVAVVVAQHG